MPVNHGFIPQLHLGMMAGAGAELPERRPSGDWEDILPDYEKQQKLGLETMNCVQFSFLNVLETLAALFGKKLNLSDRFLYWASGCTAQGNTFSNCVYGFLKSGCCAETLWEWVVAMSRQEYGKEPPSDVKEEAIKLFKEWEFGMLVWVPTTVDAMRSALKKTPLWACNQSHAFMIYRVDDRIRVFDTYGDATGGKGSFPLDYADLYAAYNVPFTPKGIIQPPMVTLPNNSLVIVVDNGERLMNVDGSKLYKDDAGKILLEVTARNAGSDGVSKPFPIIHVKAADVADLPRVNLKGEPV